MLSACNQTEKDDKFNMGVDRVADSSLKFNNFYFAFKLLSGCFLRVFDPQDLIIYDTPVQL